MITITDEKTATICEALRYWAWDISAFATRDCQCEINALRQLANELEYRLAMQSLHAEEKDDE